MPDSNFSLTAIYQASQQPARSTRLREALHSADRQAIDRLILRISNQLRFPTDNWPARRLLRCLDYIVRHASAINPHSTKLRSCIKLVMKELASDTPQGANDSSEAAATAYSGLRLIGSLLQLPTTDAFLLDEVHVTSILGWLTPTWSVQLRSCALRALAAKGQHFADDIILGDGLWVLVLQLGRVPTVLRHGGGECGGEEVDLCVRVGQLFENLVKRASKSKSADVRTKMVQFAESVQFVMIVNAWRASIELQHRKLADSLTHTVSRLISVSPIQVATYISTADPHRSWRTLLAADMKAFAKLVQQNEEVESIHATRITRVCKISLSMVLAGRRDKSRADDVARDVVNFLLVIIPRPVKPEDIDSIGTMAMATQEMWHGEVSDHVGSILLEHEQMFVTLLECFMQHIQNAHQSLVQHIAARAAFCIIAMLTALNDCNKLNQEEGLRTRLQKLVMFFLHTHTAIEMFSSAPACLNDVIWLPTIQDAKLGLTDRHHQDTTISRAKRAFTALRLATRHVRACEKLDKAGVLQLLVDMDYTKQLEDVPVKMLAVYASFMHFIAALAETMAYIRAKLRAEYPIGPLVMKLLCRAIQYRSIHHRSKEQQDGWNHIIHGSLLVVSAFGYDQASLQQWLSWPASLDEDTDEDTTWYDIVHVSDGRISVFPAILLLLLPEPEGAASMSDTQVVSHFNDQDHSVAKAACASLNLLSSVAECGSQFIRDTQAATQISTLLVHLADLQNTTKDNNGAAENNKESSNEDDRYDSDSGSGSDSDSDSDDSDGNDDSDAKVENQNSQIGLEHSSLNSPNGTCFSDLYRALMRMVTYQENLQVIIGSDVLTAIFKPLLSESLPTDQRKAQLRYMISGTLHDERLDDLVRLFRFTMRDGNATQFHELCAVALGYACLDKKFWSSALGISSVDSGEILRSNSAFSVLCRMLVYELVEGEDIVVAAPYRRHAAAQVIEVLAQGLSDAWVVELNQTRHDLELPLASRPQGESTATTVADDDTTIITITDSSNGSDSSQHRFFANRHVLAQQSPYFSALLSGQYAESTEHPIHLPDVSFDAFSVYLNTIEKASKSNDVEQVMSECRGWADVVELLMMADRFSNDDLRIFCEVWIMGQLIDAPSSSDTLNGALLLYRRCRDTEGGIFLSDIWPFSHILREALKAVVSRFSHAVDTHVFQEMVNDANPEELNAFCHGMAVLLADDR